MSRKFSRWFVCLCLLLVCLLFWHVRLFRTITAAASIQQVDEARLARASADKSLAYLREVMDRYHRVFWVYEDVSSPGNHFHAWAKFTGGNSVPTVSMNGSWKSNPVPYAGATAIQCKFQGRGSSFGGFALLNGVLEGNDRVPKLNFGTYPNAGINLTGAVSLKFRARGERGGEVINFFMGGGGHAEGLPYPDSTPAVELNGVVLTNEWKEYALDLTNKNLSYVLVGFGWGISGLSNPNGAIFYLDEIRYELNEVRSQQQLNEPRLLHSYTTLGQPDITDTNKDDDIDLVLRNTAFVYDNALALLAFLADGSADSLRRARLIGDALMYATQHDRFFNDGRLRSAYAAGDISLPPGWRPNSRGGTIPMPGFYDEGTQRFYETQEASTVDVGNNAWAMIALLALYQHTGNQCYLDTARKLGNVIHTYRHDSGKFQGFLGGTENVEALAPESPVLRGYASAEHSIDIYAAFSAMYQLTGEAQWQADAEHARIFVEKMWDEAKGCYWSGTVDDSEIYQPPKFGNMFLVPVDVQAWSLMSLPDTSKAHPKVLECAERNHRNQRNGFIGYDFNDDKDGVWFEGTSQMALAYELAGKADMALSIREQLRKAQDPVSFVPAPPSGFVSDGKGLPAAARDGLTTGFDPPDGIFHYSTRLHVGATAWNLFAQLKVNPYYQAARTNACSVLGFKAAANTDLGASARSLTTADFDADGNADLAFATAQQRLIVLLNDGRGSFRRKDHAPSPIVAYDFIAAADVNKDAKPDLLALNNGSSTSDGQLSVFLGVGDGSFRGPMTFAAGGRPKTLAFGYLNADDNLDLIVLASDGNSGRVVMLAGKGDGTFLSPAQIDVGTPAPSALALGDVDRDGKLDVIVGKGNAREVALVIGNGAGAFGKPVSFDVGTVPTYLTVSDLNKDGRLDLALLSATANRVSVLLANRVGGFGAPKEFNVGAGAPVTIATGDLNADCQIDLVVPLKNGRVAVLLGNGAGDFEMVANPGSASESSVAVIVDLNGDAKPDLVVANVNPGNAAVLLNDCLASVGLAVVSAAKFTGYRQAPDSIVAIFGTGLCDRVEAAQTLPLPTMLAGAVVTFRGNDGREHNTPLFFASPQQINCLVPREIPSGLATVSVTKGGRLVAQSAVQLEMLAPALFSANANGQGVAAGVALRIKADLTQSTEPLAFFDAMQNKYVTRPLDLGSPSERVFLVLFGTGLRYRSALGSVVAKVGGVEAPVTFVGAAPGFEGLDQINLSLPRDLLGRGEVGVVLMVDGQAANTVAVGIR